jgi:hypothetical protein
MAGAIAVGAIVAELTPFRVRRVGKSGEKRLARIHSLEIAVDPLCWQNCRNLALSPPQACRKRRLTKWVWVLRSKP